MAEAIDYFNTQSALRSLATRVALHARRGMYARFLTLAGAQPADRVLDLGVTPDTSLPDSNFLERWYPHRHNITMASHEDCSELETVFPGTTFVQIAPHQALPFTDRAFDLGFSSAVLEHVGNTAQQRFFLQELLRTSERVFLTTPDRAFPVELHTFFPCLHWLPKPLHRRVLQGLGQSFWAAESNLNLLTRRELAQLVTEALQAVGRQAAWTITRYRLLGLPSNLLLWVRGESGT
ncbi:MAG: class I SAM-dependent methyltransferase [Candidatus Tectomicrobia bacterium]|uniref:Class I SAM-dependent methyltransferase n=1 Tax=Tectimicrobiota bacterium TaxID=2528274 RepID=A0A937VZZ4_UNCTE|nr:class I SAM-dependent methyltransferase [Candidatus Tectomicrobia bacterium]